MTREERLARDGAVDPILFYSHYEENGEFSNFSPHGVYLPDPWQPPVTMRMYLTGEHRYQAMKANDKDQHDWVCDADGPGEAKNRGRAVELRDNWGSRFGDICWWVMLETVTAKLLQDSDIELALEATDDRWIYEDSPTDDIWGWRFHGSYDGLNLLGLCWMHVRATILAC